MSSRSFGDPSSRKRKRKSSHPQRGRTNPSRGGPGILLTCDTSREVKCEREGRDILRHYYDDWEQRQHQQQQQQPRSNQESAPPPPPPTTAKLSLDQELARLRQKQQQTPQGDDAFQLFATGCAGTAFLMYVAENGKEADILDKQDTATPQIDEGDEDGNDDEKAVTDKRIRAADKGHNQNEEKKKEDEEKIEDTSKSTEKIVRATKIKTTQWDPVAMVKAIASDIAKPSSSPSSSAAAAAGIPASRFVTRMIPIQVTCFASLKELETVLTYLLKNYTEKDKNKATRTFRIQIKKRNCNHISSQQFIETAAPLVMKLKSWTVQLKDPDVVVWIEVCKTLMGISLLTQDDVNVAKNFNLAELRDRATLTGDEKPAATEAEERT